MAKKKKYEAFKIEAELMDAVRKFAREDGRTIKETIQRAIREMLKK